MLGAVALALFLLFFGEFVGGISPVLMVAIPVLGLLTFVGFIVTLIGAARWAFQAPMRRLIWFGVALTSLGVACFVVGEKMHYGFDDPNILFVPAITIPPPTCGASPTGICRHSPLPRAYEHTKIAGLVVTTGSLPDSLEWQPVQRVRLRGMAAMPWRAEARPASHHR